MDPGEVNVLALVLKRGKRYIFVYDDESEKMMREHIVTLALKPGEPMTIADAQHLLERMNHAG